MIPIPETEKTRMAELVRDNYNLDVVIDSDTLTPDELIDALRSFRANEIELRGIRTKSSEHWMVYLAIAHQYKLETEVNK